MQHVALLLREIHAHVVLLTRETHEARVLTNT